MPEIPTDQPRTDPLDPERPPTGNATLNHAAPAWAVTTAVVGVFLALDLLIPFAFHFQNEWLAITLLGVCIGQVNLIATWAALAPGNLVVRLPWSLLMGMFLWYALVLGNRLNGSFPLDEATVLGAALLFGIVVAQLPLWIAKRTFRWRLVRTLDNLEQVDRQHSQFQIRHLLLGTLLLSLALSPLRVILPPGAMTGLRDAGRLILLLAIVAATNLLVTVPCIWGSLMILASLGAAILGWFFYCLFLSTVEYFILDAATGTSPNNGWFIILLINLSQCLTVFVTLRIFRAIGFRLVRLPARPSTGEQPAVADIQNR